MLEFITSKDTQTLRTELSARVATAQAAGQAVERIEAEQFQPGLLAELAEAHSLFGTVHCYILDTPSSDSDFQAAVWETVGILAAAQHTFIVVDKPLTAAERKQLPPSVVLNEVAGAPPAERFNTFQLADALARKDKRQLWVLLQQAKQAGIAAEEIIGVLWWQLKAIRLAYVTSSAEAAGLKPYVYQKATRAHPHYDEHTLRTTMQNLLAVYHDGHAGVRDIELALEAWVLRL